MKAIENLVFEHDNILKMIEIAQRIFEKQDKTNLNTDHVTQIVDFIRNFADKYHHMKEEEILFKEMGNFGMPANGGPVGVMLMEHDMGRNFVKNAVEALHQFCNGNIDVFEILKENLLDYCELLVNHIHKENHILYPMAENMLPQTNLSDMESKFNQINNSTPGNEYYDKYLKMVGDLSAVYLN